MLLILRDKPVPCRFNVFGLLLSYHIVKLPDFDQAPCVCIHNRYYPLKREHALTLWKVAGTRNFIYFGIQSCWRIFVNQSETKLSILG